jgi:hypothetical protein
MEFSKYNIYAKRDGKVSIFNTFTSALVQLDNDIFNGLFTIENNSDIIKQLIDMGIIINERKEEIQKYKYIQYSKMFRNNRIVLYICPTMNCNFSCSYCFEAGNKRKINMTEDVEDAIIRFLVKNKEKKISIIWFGGEPLLNIRTIENITKKLEMEHVNYSSSMITNGSLLNSHAIDILKKISIEFIQISMDGTKTIHDSRRYFHSGKGSFNIIISGIKRLLSETSIPITIQVAIDKTNFQEYEKLLVFFNQEFPSQMKKKRIQLNYNIVKDRTNFDTQGSCMNHQDYFDYLMRIDELKINNKRNLFLPDIASPCMYNSVGTYAITPDGEIFKCIEHVGNKNKSIGNIIKESISLERLSSCFFTANHLENSECIDCPVLPVCGGGCPLDREIDQGVNKVACSFYKTHIDNILSQMKL